MKANSQKQRCLALRYKSILPNRRLEIWVNVYNLLRFWYINVSGIFVLLFVTLIENYVITASHQRDCSAHELNAEP